MPENIFKLYRPTNRGTRKGPGLWHNESETDRFNHIKTELSRYCSNNSDYDYLDLVWHIKNAVIGDIFFSEEVYKGIKNSKYWPRYYNNKGTGQDDLIQGIMNRQTQQKNGSFDEKFLEIRKWLGSKYSNGSLYFEHIIPAKVYIDELIDAYTNNRFDINYFRWFRKQIYVCIVTKAENDCLNKNHLRESMPKSSSGVVWKFGNNPFARYDYLGIKVHK